jgi:hypothetical protein
VGTAKIVIREDFFRSPHQPLRISKENFRTVSHLPHSHIGTTEHFVILQYVIVTGITVKAALGIPSLQVPTNIMMWDSMH